MGSLSGKRRVCAIVTIGVVVGLVLGAARIGMTPQQTEEEKRVESSRHRSAIQVGTWDPIGMETPAWMFPLVRIKWGRHRDVDSYAHAHVREIKSRPIDQPIWLVTQGWFGQAKPRGNRDHDGLMAHAKDSTPSGTPGLWPIQGIEIWMQRQRRFLDTLRAADVRVDGWPLDSEVAPHRWNRNFYGPWVFRNMVRDPRWRTEPIIGVGKPGANFLDPSELDSTGQRMMSTQGDEKVPDDRLAYVHAHALGWVMRNTVYDAVFADLVHRYYPDAWTSDYNQYRRPLPAGDLGRARGLTGEMDVWLKLQCRARLSDIPGVGTHASPSLYGGRKWRVAQRYGYEKGDDAVDVMLRFVKGLIELYGSPEQVVPWVASPERTQRRHFDHTRDGDRALSAEEYERLIFGLVDLGVRRFLLFNASARNDPEGVGDTVRVFEAANRRALELDRMQRTAD